jgi:hypothetical protein
VSGPLELISATLSRALQERRMLLILWGLLTAAALLAVVPWIATATGLGFSLVGRDAPFADGPLVLELARLAGRQARSWIPMAILAAVLMTLLGPLLSGGVFDRLAQPRAARFSVARFAAASTAQLAPNLRLWGWAMLGLAVPGVALLLADSALEEAAETALYQAPLDPWRILLWVATALVLLVWRAAYDAARAVVNEENERRTRIAAWRGLRSTVTRPGVLAGYAMLSGIGLALMWVLVRVHARIPVSSSLLALLALLFGQLMVWVRLAFWVACSGYGLRTIVRIAPLPLESTGYAERPREALQGR